MAISEDERQQAEQLLYEVNRRLKIRNYQITKHGDSADPAWIIDAEDLRRKRAALEAVLTPELPDEISGLVKRRLEDDYFVFQQQIETNQRVAVVEGEIKAIKEQQYAASIERLATNTTVQRIEQRQDATERKRRFWSKVWLAVWALIFLAVVLGLVFGRIYF